MAGTDHSIILDRIIEMIKANTTLWTEDKEQKTGKLLAVKFGEPEYETIDSRQMPYCYVATTPNRLEDSRNSVGSSVNGVQQPYLATYQIGVICQKTDTEKTQRQLYSFLSTIRDIIESNPLLDDPAQIGTDAKVVRTRIISTERLTSQRGKETDLGIITIECQMFSQFTLTIAGISDIPLISKPIEREIETIQNVHDTGRIRKRTSPITETHVFFAEMQYSNTLMAALRTSKRARTDTSITLTRPSGGNTIYNGRITEISNGAASDQLETILVLFEIIH